eukprot:CAMPEP_0118682136 /NCGR_PEP_ID=MMETSP0800-20121206/5326_1 /TAXON_ID=210618 ORGANISM="Striatella unipunctata, Strain CCMP2910" /NCGR_SAMPLE_ID=MMETSP0800 /ASSEMBLY_ACC=CAM_ASM_000638 /LENGTH=131 /DNA_ID=CAMNT_0006578509 /DNA_START=66 /DNA_END=461 /DNA_ORIENTATION=+
MQKLQQPFGNKIKVLRMLTSEAVRYIPDDSLDFLHLDARHDYCGALEDLQLYWPKVKSGGFVAHDYYTAMEAKDVSPEQDWSHCKDGTVHYGAVKGAVHDFLAEKLGSASAVVEMIGSTQEDFPSYYFIKP